MDIKRFFKILKRYLWILIVLPAVACTITYFFSKNLPREYKSDLQIATGLVDQSKQVGAQGQTDFFKISQQFNNIIEKMKMRKIMSILSYNLIIHDLENPKNSFRNSSPSIDSLTVAQKTKLITIYKEKLLEKTPLTVLDNNAEFKLYSIIQSMRYDEVSIAEKLAIFRPENSDFINVEFTSENPLLSAYVVNTLASEFIQSYGVDVYTNQNNSIALLDSLLKKKEAEMNAKNMALKDFKMKNGVLNVNDQAGTLYAQISQYEDKKAQAIRDIQANLGALSAINNKLSGTGDPHLGGDVSKDNNLIISLKNQLKVANDRYIDGGFKLTDKKRIDSLQSLINRRSELNSDNNVLAPQVAKQALVQQKLNLEVNTAQIRSTISSINKELVSLKSQYNTMVPFDAGIQNYERDAEIATKDYMAALDRTNQGRTEQNTGLKLQIAQMGLPGVAQTSKAIVYIALSGIATFSFCFMTLLLMFFLDKSIYTPFQLKEVTNSPVLGSLNYIHAENKDPKSIWEDKSSNFEYTIFKDLIRSLRFEIDKDFSANNCKILGVTSLNLSEGKSFISSALIYSFAMTGKKVLLISGEGEQTDRSPSMKLIPSEFVETFIVKKEVQTEDLITVFNSKFNESSLLETQNTQNLKIGFDILKTEFDFILIDINSLKEVSRAKEWLYFTDRSIAIFEYGKTIDSEDKEAIEYIRKVPGFMGWVLNKVKDKKAV